MSHAERSDGPDFVYFFLPLPEPLRLPDAFVLETVVPVDFIMLREIHERDGTHEVPDAPLICSVRVLHQPMDAAPLFVPPMQAAMDAARRALPFVFTDDEADSDEVEDVQDMPELTWTVAEAAVPLEREADDKDALGQAFDTAMEAVRRLQRAYSIATKDPVTLVAQENLPPVVPYTFRWVQTGVLAEDRWAEGVGSYVINDNVAVHVRGGDITAAEHDMFDAVIAADRQARPFLGYADMRRDAAIALRSRGDYRAAVVAAETAAQVLLDDLLLHMLWEERVPPGEAAQRYFREQGLAARVRTHYHERLGGNWSTNRGPIGDWRNKLSSVRHRVVHAGYSPTRQEARAALNALDGLENFILNRLLQSRVLPRYPRTAMSLLGKPTIGGPVGGKRGCRN